MLVIHERKHTGEKPFECSVCKMRFKQSGTLRDHMMTHTGEKRYACPVCDYKCIQCTDMTKHLKKHGNVPPIDLKSCLIPGMLTNIDLTHMPYSSVLKKSKSLILFRSLLLISKQCYFEHTCFTRSKVVVWNDPGPIEESWSLVSTQIPKYYMVYTTQSSQISECKNETSNMLAMIYHSNYKMGHFYL